MELNFIRRGGRGIVAVGAALSLLAAALVVSTTAQPARAEVRPAATGAYPPSGGQPQALAGGSVYYVDSATGNDSAAGTSAQAAWKSLARVSASGFSPGDVIAFKRGQTFTGSATIASAGTVNAPITLTSYGTGNRPVLTNPGGWNMLVLDAPYLAVTDLSFTDGVVFTNDDGTGIRGPKYERSGAVAITSNGSAARVSNSVFTDVGVGVKTYGADSVIERNTFEDLRIAFRGMDSGSETSYGALGVSINNSGVRVSQNDFLDCRSTDSPYGADGGAIEIEGFAHAKNNITIDHNYSRGSQGFLEVTETTSANVTLSYNISDDYQQFVAWDTTTHPTGYLAENNTVVRSRDDSRLFDQYFYREEGPEPTADWITIRNNIFLASAWLTFHDFPRDHNIYGHGVGLDIPLGPGDMVTDPALMDPAQHDLRPSALSPAIDNGAATNSAVDVFGNPTALGSGVDIGAVEYQQVPVLGASLLQDGGFESMTALTSTSTPWATEGQIWFGLDNQPGKAHSGNGNAWMVGEGDRWGAITQTIPVTPNTTYRMSAWVRGAAGVDAVWIGARAGSGAVLNEMRVGGRSDYTPHTLTFSSGSSSSVTVFLGMWSAPGGLWLQVDDVTVQKVTSTGGP